MAEAVRTHGSWLRLKNEGELVWSYHMNGVMVNRVRWSFAVLIAVVGIVLALRALSGNPNARTSHTPPPALEDVEALESARFVGLASNAQIEEALNQLTRNVKGALARLPNAHRLSGGKESAFLEVLRERLLLYLAPDYDQYVQQVSRWSGLSPEQLGQSEWLLDRSEWEAAEARYASENMQLAPDGVRVRVLYKAGVESFEFPGGHQTVRKALDLYGVKRDPEGFSADVYEAIVPVRLRAGGVHKSERVMRAYLTLSFLWHPERGRWLPWQAGVFDPSDSGVVLFAPWI